MKSRLPFALALTGLMGVGVLMAAQPANAESSPPAAQTMMPKEEYKLTAADRAAFAEARIAALKAGLALTADQEKLWPPVETVLRDMAKARAAHWQKMHEKMEAKEHPVIDPVERLKRMAEHKIARGEALKELADALAPLYAKLDEGQKHRLPILLHAIHPHHHHHFAWHEGEHEHGGWHHHWRDMMESGMMGRGMMREEER